MKVKFAYMVSTCLSLLTSTMVFATENSNSTAEQLYQQHCQSCHGIDRMGAMGPALFPENLSRLRKKQALDVITHGRAATQMPAFSNTLAPEQINQLADYIYTAPATAPKWQLADINATHVEYKKLAELSDKPLFKADPMNLFIVVELGDHHATLLNGDTFEPITRFKTRFALHGGPKYSPDGRFVYFASRDGWISKYDIYNMSFVAEIRAGINTRNLAISSDGKYATVGNYLPHNVVLLETEHLTPIALLPTVSQQNISSRVSAVYNAPQRNSFIVALKDAKEVWEINYPKNNQSVIKPRRIETDDYLDDFFFDMSYQHLIGTSRTQHNGQVIDLDQGKKITEIAIKGMPHLGSGITWQYQGKTVFASPNIKQGLITVVDMSNWQVIKEIKTDGPGFFMRSHHNSKYAWADVFFGPKKDEMHIIDKASLEIVKTITPIPGKTSAHVEFTKDGKYVLLSIWEDDGALIIYDANTLEEIKRLPMRKPSGKYNVYNKTHYEQGTSH